jgi:hypothetical protein
LPRNALTAPAPHTRIGHDKSARVQRFVKRNRNSQEVGLWEVMLTPERRGYMEVNLLAELIPPISSRRNRCDY